MNIRTLVIAVFVLLSFIPAGMVLAAAGTGVPSTGITLINPLGAGTDLLTLLNKILDFVIQIGAIVIIFMLVYVGFLYVYNAHNPAEITKAHKALLYIVIGALILLGSKAIALGITATVQAISAGK